MSGQTGRCLHHQTEPLATRGRLWFSHIFHGLLLLESKRTNGENTLCFSPFSFSLYPLLNNKHWKDRNCRRKRGIWQVTSVEVTIHEAHHRWGSAGGLDYYCIAHSAQWVLEALGLGSTTRNSSCAVVVRPSSFSSQNVQNITLTHSSLYLAIPFHHCPSSLFMSFCMDQSSTPHQPFHSALISLVLLCVSGSLSTGHQPSPSYRHLHRPLLPLL